MTKLSVNINKLATLRNSRGGNNPNIVQAAIDAQRFGADGITVHPRPDERHIRYKDVKDIKKVIITEFNIEGNCTEQKFVDLVLETKPDQVTLVPDTLGQLTSDHGWDTIKNKDYLRDIIAVFKTNCYAYLFCKKEDTISLPVGFIYPYIIKPDPAPPQCKAVVYILGKVSSNVAFSPLFLGQLELWLHISGDAYMIESL